MDSSLVNAALVRGAPNATRRLPISSTSSTVRKRKAVVLEEDDHKDKQQEDQAKALKQRTLGCSPPYDDVIEHLVSSSLLVLLPLTLLPCTIFHFLVHTICYISHDPPIRTQSSPFAIPSKQIIIPTSQQITKYTQQVPELQMQDVFSSSRMYLCRETINMLYLFQVLELSPIHAGH